MRVLHRQHCCLHLAWDTRLQRWLQATESVSGLMLMRNIFVIVQVLPAEPGLVLMPNGATNWSPTQVLLTAQARCHVLPLRAC